MENTIDPRAKIGAVHLTVSDLERSVSYYEQQIGLELISQETGQARLGAAGQVLLVLTEQRGATVARGVTGLYHFALLLPSRLDLACSLQHLIETRTQFSGFADHGVSEAMYLSDPDGHGIEIYRDRPRGEWEYRNGSLHMVTEPFDAEGVLAELQGNGAGWHGLSSGTRVGHIHLHVSDLSAAAHFYTNILGFGLVARYGPSALFVSAGGYHHHVGLNTWAGVGVPAPSPESLSLQWYEVRLSGPAELDRVLGRIRDAGLDLEEDPAGYVVRDPAGNRLLLTSR